MITKDIGVWMDHSSADFIDLYEQKNNHTITSKFTNNVKQDALNRNENLMHNKENQLHEAYYKNIAEALLKYDRVLLFGPTQAKVELHNYLNKDSHFKDIKIDIETADKMTTNEKHAFVKDHFDKKSNYVFS